MLSFITWTVDPVAFSIPFLGREVRWYGICFALGFAIGSWLVWKQWQSEKLPEPWFEKLFLYVIAMTIVGSRLGHCLFYNILDFSAISDTGKHFINKESEYFIYPWKILYIWEGGLASHGGTLGIIIGMWFYCKWVTNKSMLWVLDRLVVPVGFTAAFIRLGNLMNHEIYGHVTDKPWGFRFTENLAYMRRGMEPIFSAPSHPTQIYEMFFYVLTSCICMWMYWKRKDYNYAGLIFGVFLIGIFLPRFFIEFLKNVQESFEVNMTLDMGQWLSIPFIAAGIYLACKGLKAKLAALSK
ncbi:prolipoprotein diacylglyceryl transferase [Candidatus Symbiothrix dinenymphae]|nr:prolipoprotein diacylglyceryl transferase [Candidatus Symbiothrix dinenymphae]